jgi:acyl dehydratase
MQTKFTPQRLLERTFAPVQHPFGEKDVQLYALALGFGADPLDADQLSFVYEGGSNDALKVVPTFANVLAYPGFWAREPDTGIDWRRVVHAEQEIVWHRKLPPSGNATGYNRVSAVWDRGAVKGAFLQQQREVRDSASNEMLVTVTQLSLLRGDGGFGAGGSEGAPPAPHRIPERPADLTCDLPSLPQAALIYRLTGDRNPLHADPEVASEAGFERPILHGMATMGIAAHAVMRALLGYDAAAMATMRCRFVAAAVPGDTFRTELWQDGRVISFQTTALERGVLVLGNGRVKLH